MPREGILGTQKGKIAKMLVVNGVKLIAFNQPLKVRKLHGDDPVWLQQNLHPGNKVVQIRHMSQNIITKQQVSLLSLSRQLVSGRPPEETDERWNSASASGFGDVGG